MKALTTWQPYASLLVGQEFKRFETRGWATSYTGPIAIHAAKRPVAQVMHELEEEMHWGTIRNIWAALGGIQKLDLLPTGAIIGIGTLERCNAITEDFMDELSPMERSLGDYSPGRFAWEFSGLHFIDPIPISGKQGLWNWEGCA